MELNKIKTYINFSKRSRNIVYGVEDIVKSKKIEIVFISNDLAESSKNKLDKFINDKNIFKIYIDKNDMFELLQVNAVKAFGITDANLAKAIKMNFTNNVSNGGNLE